MIKISKTNRGFTICEFEDSYEYKCSIQESSACCRAEKEGNYIWLGNDDADPQIMAAEAHLVGVKTNKTTGWVPYPIPENVLLHTKMHLSQRQVKELLPLLEHFVKTGELPKE